MSEQAVTSKTALETIKEKLWRELAEDRLILVYVPEAEYLSHDEALKLALERDKNASAELLASAQTSLDLENAAKKIRGELSGKQKKALSELGFDISLY